MMSKVRLNVTISQEAKNKLGANPSAAIESMVMEKSPPQNQALKNEIVYQTERILDAINGLSSNGRTMDFDSINLGSSPSEPANWIEVDPRAEIRRLEGERDERLEFMQDQAVAKKITSEYQKKIDAEWSKITTSV